MPVYKIVNPIGEARHTRLIRAPNRARALAYVVKRAFEVEVASSDDLIELITTGGVPVESVDEPQVELGEAVDASQAELAI